jgi:uncharacterized membrane protein
MCDSSYGVWKLNLSVCLFIFILYYSKKKKFYLSVCLFYKKKKKKNCVMLLIERDCIASVVYMSLVSLTS